MSTAGASIGTLTPSEQALLNGARFAAKGGLLDRYKVLGTEIEVAKKQLTSIVYAAAFLALESAGALRLEIRSKKALLGLRTVQALYADPASEDPAWPGASLEARIRPLAASLQARKGQNEVEDIVYALLGRDETSPFDAALEIVQAGLARRQLLAVIEEKKLKIFTVRHYELPEATAALAQGAAEQVAGLLANCQSGRPEIWKMLLSQVEHGIQQRTKQEEPVDNS